MASRDTRLSKGFPLRESSQLGKYSDASEIIYVMRQDVTENGNQEVLYYIARDLSFYNEKIMELQEEPWIEPPTENLLDSVGENVDGMMHHDTYTTWWKLAVDSDEAAYTLFMLVVWNLLIIRKVR